LVLEIQHCGIAKSDESMTGVLFG